VGGRGLVKGVVVDLLPTGLSSICLMGSLHFRSKTFGVWSRSIAWRTICRA